jgi:hypothetical protein
VAESKAEATRYGATDDRHAGFGVYNKPMKLHLLAPALFFVSLFAMSDVSQGQIGIYITPAFTSIHNTTPDQGVFSFLGTDKTSRTFSGVGFGAYDQFLHTPKVDVGGDSRLWFQRGESAALNEFLVGARVNFHPFTVPIKPYAELLGGVGGTRSPTNRLYVSRATYSGSAGLDYPLGKNVDLRVIEVGYQSLQTINTELIGGVSNPPGASRLLDFSTGIVFVIGSQKAATP